MKILIALSGADSLMLKDGSLFPAGTNAGEFVTALERFGEEGFVVETATPGGVVSPIDPLSVSYKVPGNSLREIQRSFTLIKRSPVYNSPLNLDTVSREVLLGFDGLFIPSGYGPMEDLGHSERMGEVIRWFISMDKPVGAVGHGTAALLTAADERGDWLFRGYKMTGFSNSEEDSMGLKDDIPFLIETRMKELGGDYSKSRINFRMHIVEDRNIVTGQNSTSINETISRLLNKMKALHGAIRFS